MSLAMFALGFIAGVAVVIVLAWAFDRADCGGCP